MENEMEAGVIRGLYGDAQGNESENGNCFSTWVYIGTTIRLLHESRVSQDPNHGESIGKKRETWKIEWKLLYVHIFLYM